MPEDLIERCRAMAATGEHCRGPTILLRGERVMDLARLHRPTSRLDQGCGAGEAWMPRHRLRRVFGLHWFNVKLDDPASGRFTETPHALFDGVLASDMAEHMPEEQVPTFITTLFRHARKFVWASVYIRPAKKCVLGSDITPHATLRSMEWWQEQCTAASGGAPFHWVETS